MEDDVDRTSERDNDVDESARILERQRGLHRRDREWSRETIDHLTTERDEARAHAARLTRRLERIESGRWWRLRALLLRVARVLGMGRPDASADAPTASDDAPTASADQRRADTESPVASAQIRPTEASLAFWPDVRGNPFQRLLYGRVEDAGLRLVPLRELVELSPAAPAPAGSVLHLHWTSPVMHTARTERDARTHLWGFTAALDDLRAAGWTLIWTVHNVLPHDCRFPDLEAQLCQEIADRSDAIHVMCAGTADAVAHRYVLPPSRVRVIPHPSFDGVYANDVSQAQARRELGLGDDDTVVGAIGAVRPYKRLDALVDAYEEAARHDPALRLVIAGAPARTPGIDALIDRCARHPGIVARFERIPDEEMQRYVNACDALILGQSHPLNSGSVLLAFTFGRPVIAPRRGCVAGLVAGDAGVTFDPGDPGDLVRALKAASDLKDDRFRRAAKARAVAARPDEIAKRFASLVSELASAGRAPS